MRGIVSAIKISEVIEVPSKGQTINIFIALDDISRVWSNGGSELSIAGGLGGAKYANLVLINSLYKKNTQVSGLIDEYYELIAQLINRLFALILPCCSGHTTSYLDTFI